jgi:hypothetical protein
MRLSAVLALLIAAAGAAAGDLGGRALLTYRDYGTEGLATDGFSQLYDARYEKQIVDPFRIRLTLRAERNDTASDNGLGPISRDFRQFEPGAEVFYVLPTFQAQGTWDRIRTTSSIEGGPENVRRLERLLGYATWRGERLPGLSFQAERRSVEDAFASIERDETILTGTADYTFRGLTLTGLLRQSELDDGQLVFARSTYERQGLLNYEGSFFRGRINASAYGQISSTQLDERASDQPVTILTPVTVAAAYRSVDDTPLEDDGPPAEIPALIDGNVDRSAGVSLGPDAPFYQNFALDIGRTATLDAFRIHLRDPDGRPVPIGIPIPWDVYVSADGIRWTPVSAGVVAAFVPTLGYYELRFDRSTARYFKLVNFQTNSVACTITEIQAFSLSEFEPGETRRTDILLKSGTVSVSVAPVPRLRLSYDGLYNIVDQESDVQTMSNESLEHLAAAQLDYWRRGSLIARYQTRHVTQTGIVFDQDYEAWTGILEVRPLPSATQSLEFTRSREQNTGRDITSDTLVLHTYTRLYPTLDLTLDVGTGKQAYSGLLAALDRSQNVDRRYLTAVSRGQLTRGVTLTLMATIQRADYEGGFVPLPPTGGGLLPPEGIALPPTRDDRWSAEVYYRPGSRLGLSARIGRANAGAISGILQRYHLDWYPLAGAAVALGVTYDEDVDSVANRHARRLVLTPSWTINRRTILNLNYTRLTTSGVVDTAARSFYVTLTFTL